MSTNFTPLSSQLGISGTSYRLQVGKVGNSWAARLIKGNDVVASQVINELNGNLIVGFVIKETAIPNLNPYQIMKTVQFLTKEAQANEGRMKQGGIPAPGPEVQARLQASAAPAATPAVSRAQPAAPAASKPPANADLASDEDTRASYRIVPKAREEVTVEQEAPTEAAKIDWGGIITLGKDRKLKPIPTAETSAGAGAAPAPAPAKAAVQAPAPAPVKAVAAAAAAAPAATAVPKATDSGISDRLLKIEERISKIEERLSKIEEKLA
nr:hypothetical protein [Candidatus Sigynarchaeota archaeon]